MIKIGYDHRQFRLGCVHYIWPIIQGRLIKHQSSHAPVDITVTTTSYLIQNYLEELMSQLIEDDFRIICQKVSFVSF